MGAGLSSNRGAGERLKESTACAPTLAEKARAMELKDLGNEHFRAGKFKEAEHLYSQALVLTY